MDKKITLKRILRVNKPQKIKLTATLSALSNKLGIIPTKLVAEIKDLLKERTERAFLEIIIYEDKSLKLVLCEKSHVSKINELCKKGLSDPELKKEIDQYVKKTFDSTQSYALDIEARKKELMGTVRSILKRAIS